ncbi:MAG TPA: threonine synthase [Clostridiales bacterium]|nr:threonine synthase [Clostridiales bacterium]
MTYKSTRGEEAESSAKVILNGIASDGGLYTPSFFPSITMEDIKEMAGLDYAQRAAYILSLYLTDYGYDELLEYAKKAYSRFDEEMAAPLTKVDEKTFILELWHGPTLAFKDVALTILPYLLTGARKKQGQEKKTLILVATSGDTGKAALEGFKDVENTEIVVFYPNEGVSAMQKLQMQTAEGSNTHVVAIEGNFDDAQKAVKDIFTDKAMIKKLSEMGYELSSANSINFGRLAPQIVYYISSYVDLLVNEEIEEGEEINFIVPCGNFGNILAAYYAYRMGLPIKHFIVASNKNKVLTDFFDTGEYNINREFYRTISPSMDILVSSNLERLIFEFTGRDCEKVKSLIEDLKESGMYRVDEDELYEKLPQFIGYFSTEEETRTVIENFFNEYNYLLDPHTAVAVSAYNKYMSDTYDNETVSVIASTAHPFKFPEDVYEALTKKREKSGQKAIKKLYAYTGIKPPSAIAELEQKQILHDIVIPKSGIKDTLIKILQKD